MADITITSLRTCLESLGERATMDPSRGAFCNATWDTILCWPATPAGETTKLNCPALKGLDTSKFAHRTCGKTARWQGRQPGDYASANGWTDYTACYHPDVLHVVDSLYGQEDAQKRLDIASNTRAIEMFGLTLSFTSLVISLCIFCYFRSLKCSRTVIHRHMFTAMLIQVTLRLIIYIDQFIIRRSSVGPSAAAAAAQQRGIDNTVVLCEAIYCLLEYARTAMFMWFLLEGITLNSMISGDVFSSKPNYRIYYIVGWGSPILLTLSWAVTTGILYHAKCWFGYSILKIFWVIEGPRVAVIILNIGFLFNIIRVLVTKMRATNSSEAEQVRKSVKAAIVLVPLLGITNALNMMNISVATPLPYFALWSYSSHVLTSSQGFIVSLVYCFTNGEVRRTLRRHWLRHRLGSSVGNRSRRFSRTSTVWNSTVTETRFHGSDSNKLMEANETSPVLVAAAAAQTPDIDEKTRNLLLKDESRV